MKFEQAKSKFIKVKCAECKNEQIVFGNASSNVSCLVCGKEILEATGGRANVKAKIVEIYN